MQLAPDLQCDVLHVRLQLRELLLGDGLENDVLDEVAFWVRGRILTCLTIPDLRCHPENSVTIAE